MLSLDRLNWLGERLKDIEERLKDPEASAGRRRQSDAEFSALPFGSQVFMRTSTKMSFQLVSTSIVSIIVLRLTVFSMFKIVSRLYTNSTNRHSVDCSRDS